MIAELPSRASQPVRHSNVTQACSPTRAPPRIGARSPLLKSFVKQAKNISAFLGSSPTGGAYGRFLRWQLASKLLGNPMLLPWVGGTRLIAGRGETTITGNYYRGLMEPAGMAFLLHFLRPGDLFVDVGANLGTYTVLASGAVKAHSIAVEPVPATFNRLLDHIHLNRLGDLVEARPVGASSSPGELRFTSDQGPMNTITSDVTRGNTIVCKTDTLDNIVGQRDPALIKVDVEGHDAEALAGAADLLLRPTLKALIVEVFEAPEIIRMLTDKGFQMYSYSPDTRETSPVQRETPYNTLFLRDLDTIKARVASAESFRIFDKTF